MQCNLWRYTQAATAKYVYNARRTSGLEKKKIEKKRNEKEKRRRQFIILV